jgi:predicted O-methyltransferase YrrM
MDVTKRLLDADPTLARYNEGNWALPFRSDVATYSSFNDAGIECETGEFLYAMIRMLKPDAVLETGTHWGVGAAYMGSALKENNKGKLDTVEFLEEIYTPAVKRMKVLGLDSVVTCHLGDVKDFTPQQQYQLILLDTEPQTRFAEFEKFFPYLDKGGYIFIHDLHRHMHQIPNTEHGFAWPFGKVPPFMLEMVRSGQVRPFHFPTPRGMTGFYKVSDYDYSWNEQ